MPMKRSLVPLLAALLLCALLCGCGQKEVSLGGESIPTETDTLQMVLSGEELARLDAFPQLKTLDLSGSDCYDEILSWAAAHPDVEVLYTVTLPDGSVVDNHAAALDLTGMTEAQVEETLPLLAFLPDVKRVELGADREASTVRAYQSILGLEVPYSVRIQGRELDMNTRELDLSEATDKDVAKLLPWLPSMPQLQHVELGSGDAADSRISWANIKATEEAAPQAVFDYAFTLFGQDHTLQDTVMNYSHVTMEDEGALMQSVALCMPQLQTLDMDTCGVSDEAMAQIRDSLPNTEVIWRIWFGDFYTARTNVEMLLASNPGRGGNLYKSNTESLKYLTRLKYLDLGHDDTLDDISFIRYMPDLEVAIFAMNCWWDTRPLADCPKLEYLELQTGAITDLRPLAGLKNLRHLNICYNFSLHDITPLYDLDLERLWIGLFSPVDQEQIQEFKRRHPNCEVNTTTVDPTEEGWRSIGWDEFGAVLDTRYALLRRQFRYDEKAYAYCDNDPLYWGPIPMW
ncbi:MAG: leucine-rich repeat domain-containing protein [Oscillospiraceae bacterium]|nr:leucine-rich repeat domain-containing protein [Oscillospiraceae bacterium]